MLDILEKVVDSHQANITEIKIAEFGFILLAISGKDDANAFIEYYDRKGRFIAKIDVSKLSNMDRRKAIRQEGGQA